MTNIDNFPGILDNYIEVKEDKNTTYTLLLHQLLYFTRCYIVSNTNGEFITFHELKNNVICNKPGHIELVPEELTNLAYLCINKTLDNYIALHFDIKNIVGLSISTVRNVTVVWSKATGQSLYNALPEYDIRCEDASQKLIHKSWRRSGQNYQHLCGLPISARWMGVKVRWLIDHIDRVAKSLSNNDLMVGCLDSWLVYQLSARTNHICSVNSAAYSQLMNLYRSQWDATLCKALDISTTILPTIYDWPAVSTRPQLQLQYKSEQKAAQLCLPLVSMCNVDRAALLSVIDNQQPANVLVYIEPHTHLLQITIATGPDEPLFYRSPLPGLGYPLTTRLIDPNYYGIETTICSCQNIVGWLSRLLSDVGMVTTTGGATGRSSAVNTATGPAKLSMATETGESVAMDTAAAAATVPNNAGGDIDLDTELSHSCGTSSSLGKPSATTATIGNNLHNIQLPLTMSYNQHTNRYSLDNIDVTSTRIHDIIGAALQFICGEIDRFLQIVTNGMKLAANQRIHLCGDAILVNSEKFCQLLADVTQLQVVKLTMNDASVIGSTLLSLDTITLDPSGIRYPLCDSYMANRYYGNDGTAASSLLLRYSGGGTSSVDSVPYFYNNSGYYGSFAAGVDKNLSQQQQNQRIHTKFKQPNSIFGVVLGFVAKTIPFTLLGFGLATWLAYYRIRLPQAISRFLE